MKIKIIKCSVPTSWYSNKIGAEFFARHTSPGEPVKGFVLSYKNETCFILAEDAEVVSEQNNQVAVDDDTYRLIQLTKEVLEVSESKAVCVIIEIGLVNILAFPTGSKTIDNILSQGKYPQLVARVKEVWVL